MDGEIRELRRQIQLFIDRFTVAKLKILLKAYSLASTGKKDQLQERLLLYTRGATESFLRGFLTSCKEADMEIIPSRVVNQRSASSTVAPMSYTQQVNNIAGEFARSTGRSGTSNLPPKNNMQSSQMGSKVSEIGFMLKPFYTIHKRVSTVVVISKPHRTGPGSRQLTFQLHANDVKDLVDQNVRIAVLCQQYDTSNTEKYIYFPFQCELQINNSVISGNLRGIKGHPGSTRPADFTDKLLQSQEVISQLHTLLFRYSVNIDGSKDDYTGNKSFAFGVYLIKVESVENLVEILKGREHIKKSDVLKMLNGDVDDDIVATEAVHSLTDPITFTRMTLPVRSRRCDHIDCMDATSFLTFTKQSPTWKCPHCNKDISFDELAVDDYMREILEQTNSASKKVVVSPDGNWKVEEESSDDDDSSSDEEVEPPKKKLKPSSPVIIDLLDDSDEDLPTQPPQLAATGPTAPSRQMPSSHAAPSFDSQNHTATHVEQTATARSNQTVGSGTHELALPSAPSSLEQLYYSSTPDHRTIPQPVMAYTRNAPQRDHHQELAQRAYQQQRLRNEYDQVQRQWNAFTHQIEHESRFFKHRLTFASAEEKRILNTKILKLDEEYGRVRDTVRSRLEHIQGALKATRDAQVDGRSRNAVNQHHLNAYTRISGSTAASSGTEGPVTHFATGSSNALAPSNGHTHPAKASSLPTPSDTRTSSAATHSGVYPPPPPPPPPTSRASTHASAQAVAQAHTPAPPSPPAHPTHAHSHSSTSNPAPAPDPIPLPTSNAMNSASPELPVAAPPSVDATVTKKKAPDTEKSKPSLSEGTETGSLALMKSLNESISDLRKSSLFTKHNRVDKDPVTGPVVSANSSDSDDSDDIILPPHLDPTSSFNQSQTQSENEGRACSRKETSDESTESEDDIIIPEYLKVLESSPSPKGTTQNVKRPSGLFKDAEVDLSNFDQQLNKRTARPPERLVTNSVGTPPRTFPATNGVGSPSPEVEIIDLTGDD